jgi:hypothetical protein
MEHVGGISVKNGKIYCRACLVDLGILYYWQARIMAEEAQKNGYVCNECGVLLTEATKLKDK